MICSVIFISFTYLNINSSQLVINSFNNLNFFFRQSVKPAFVKLTAAGKLVDELVYFFIKLFAFTGEVVFVSYCFGLIKYLHIKEEIFKVFFW